MNFDPKNPFFDKRGHSTYIKLLNLEQEYLPAVGYSNSNPQNREQDYSTIIDYSDHNYPFIAYLAMNYFDRYISRRPLPDEESRRYIISICCLILAHKMILPEFSVPQFLSENVLELDMNQIKRVEWEILSELKWNMRSITPICFINLFIPYFGLMDRSLGLYFKRKAIQNIYLSQRGIHITEYKPSLVAASALLEASMGLFHDQAFRERLGASPFANREKLIECHTKVSTVLECIRWEKFADCEGGYEAEEEEEDMN